MQVFNWTDKKLKILPTQAVLEKDKTFGKNFGFQGKQNMAMK